VERPTRYSSWWVPPPWLTGSNPSPARSKAMYGF
jgi:hypothetical protein